MTVYNNTMYVVHDEDIKLTHVSTDTGKICLFEKL